MLEEEEAPALRPSYARVPRLPADSPEALKHFEDEGFVVIAGALTSEESKTALSLTWDFMEGLGTGIRRSDPSTWSEDRWPTIAHGAIIPGHGIGHCEAQWFIRACPNVKKAFASIWGTDDLLASFDGMALWRPWHANPAWRTGQGAGWLHVDQNPETRPGFQCAQGLVSLLPMDPSTGGNVLIPRSHKSMFHRIPELYPERWSKVNGSLPGVDHFRFPPNDEHCQGVQMSHMEVGDMLLWDSRLVHSASPGLEAPRTPKDALLRCVSLVCMMPRELTPADVLERRKEAVRRLHGTTNWTDRWVNADDFPLVAQNASRDEKRGIRKPKAPSLSAAQLRLVGYTEEEAIAMTSGPAAKL